MIACAKMMVVVEILVSVVEITVAVNKIPFSNLLHI